MFSQVSTQVVHFALPLVAVVALHAGEFEVGLLTALGTAAFLLVGLPAGAWVDRMRRRSVLVMADIGRAVLLASIPLAWVADLLTIGQLYAVALLLGVLTVFFDVAYQSYLPHLVGRENIVEGNAKLEVIRATTQLGGPSLAGGLVQWLGAPIAILANVVSFGASALGLGSIRKREPPVERAPGSRLRTEIAEGVRFVLGNRLLRSIAACTGGFNLMFSMVTAMEMVFFVRDIGLKPGQVGLLFSVAAVGGLLGALLVDPLVRLAGQGPAIWMSTAFTAPFGLLIPFAQPGWRVWLTGFGMVVLNVGMVVYNVTQVSFRQTVTPEPLLGRMNATMRFLVWGTMPLGGLLGGVAGSVWGARTTLWIGTIGACFTFLPTFFSPLRRRRALF